MVAQANAVVHEEAVMIHSSYASASVQEGWPVNRIMTPILAYVQRQTMVYSPVAHAAVL